MRMSLAVNGKQISVASLEASGWLSAHVNLSVGVNDGEPPNRVWLHAIDHSDEPNSVFSEWEGVFLNIGDKVDIEILPEGESDPATTITKSSERPNNLFSNVEQARSLLAAIQICDAQLMGVLERARDVEPTEELKKIQSAVGQIIVELDQQLISPTLRRHPELQAEAKAKGLR